MSDETTRTPAAPTETSVGVTVGQVLKKAVDLHSSGDLDAAKALYRRILSRVPDHTTAWTNLGALHRAEKDFDGAVACQRRAHSLGPDQMNVLSNLSNVLFDVGELDECERIRADLVRREPDDPERHQNLAAVLRALGRNTEAEAACDRGLAIDPDHEELRLQRALALLAQGQYSAGFEAFEARWSGDEISKPTLKEPEWNGEPVDGKTILVMPEQGFGDTVLMARFLPALKAKGARVLLGCKEPLMRLFSGLEGVDELVLIGGKKPSIDMWVSMMSLPRHVKWDPSDPMRPATLKIPEDSRQRAAHIVSPFASTLNVGVLWSGSVTYRANHKRSFAMDKLYGLAALPGVQLFSLYKGPLLDGFRKDGLSSVIIDASGDDRDFADTAALMSTLDVIVSMDSAVVHIAGSLGLPVWNLLHYSAYWLYGTESESTPWYPSMRLVRQKRSGDWDSVFDRVRADLGSMVAARA